MGYSSEPFCLNISHVEICLLYTYTHSYPQFDLYVCLKNEH